ncbi:uncharacterized protein EDB91DRAFT_674141 [Suillus paluster]|uniref:uncharacterized protein n=1 Tax=Suillus paluster TaxID=48578 RepID=UPI001B86B22F|nr:uncharacterized protein EDB91DRAFT_674141 [Suillus paluster]KAG1732420.1 hypothetical protein EDB91DRAFT_674141 [Suillus paluster]
MLERILVRLFCLAFMHSLLIRLYGYETFKGENFQSRLRILINRSVVPCHLVLLSESAVRCPSSAIAFNPRRRLITLLCRTSCQMMGQNGLRSHAESTSSLLDARSRHTQN